MFPLFITFILGSIVVWRLGAPAPRSIFAPHRRRSIVDRRQRCEEELARAAQERAALRIVYGPLNDAQRDTYHQVHERIDDLRKAA
ncbi:MAG: hypothetical protein U0166_20875 [Acidobacteriota bacterium]